MSASLQRATDQFQKMSPREQRLAVGVAVLLVLFIAFYVGRMALESLASLDAQIGRLQTQILNVDNQIKHRESIEAQYARVASQHSSDWSAAEIHDRLRAEIYRLAQKQPPALNENGVPEKVTNSAGELVSIPTIQQGNLTEGEQGYREYTLSFSIPATSLQNIVNFIDRLQNSPQSLRVDVIELTRDPIDEKVAANLTITRTIVAGVKEDKKPKPAAKAPAKDDDAKAADAKPKGQRLNPGEWKCDNGAVTAEPEQGEPTAIVITPKAAGATAYIERAMPPAVYEVSIDLLAEGPARLAVADSGKELDGAIDIPGNGQVITCKFQFRPSSQERAPLRIPLLIMKDAKSVLHITRMSMEKVAE